MNKKLLYSAAILILSSTMAFAAGADWMTDFDKALEKAKAEQKMVLLDFTGSDWCGWCIKLNKEVFSTKEFKDYAKENLVLVEVDFPRSKKLSAKLQKQNDELMKRYGIRGFPTIIVLDSEGETVGKLGYMEGGPEPFVSELQKLQKKS